MSTVDACPQIPFLQVDPMYRIFYAAYVATMAICGISANGVLLVAIMKNSKYFLSIDIFHITISQTIIGCVYLSGFLTVAGPGEEDLFLYYIWHFQREAKDGMVQN